MSHLDDLAAAIVDDELSHDQRDRALAHLAACGACREEVEAQRRLKARLAAAQAPTISFEMTVRLLAIPSNPPAPQVRTRGALPTGRPRGIRRPAARPMPARRRMAGSISALAVVLGGAMLLGGEKGGVQPPVVSFVEQHTATNVVQNPLSDPAAVLLTSYPAR